jgi:hypothetical protein
MFQAVAWSLVKNLAYEGSVWQVTHLSPLTFQKFQVAVVSVEAEALKRAQLPYVRFAVS